MYFIQIVKTRSKSTHLSTWLSRVHLVFTFCFLDFSPVFIFQRDACWTQKHPKLVLMIVTHETGNDGFKFGIFFSGYLHVISDLYIQLDGDISPFWWVLGSLRFLVFSIFLYQHKDCRFSQLGKYYLWCGSGNPRFC